MFFDFDSIWLWDMKFTHNDPLLKDRRKEYCCETKLVIELDGDYHDYQLEYDQERDDFLRSNGCNIVRFPNEMIHGSLQKVLEVIKEKLISS